MTFQTYPLGPSPAYYVQLTPLLTGGGRCRNGLFYVGEDVTFGLSSATPDAYELLDYDGNTVASGAVAGTTIDLGSSLDAGWYRLRLTGALTDPLFGESYGATVFIVARDTGVLTSRPASTFAVFNWKPNGYGRTDAEVDAGSGNGGTTDMILRTMFGIGAGRNEWHRNLTLDPHGHADDNGGISGIEDFQQWATNVGNPYWLDSGVADPVRPRAPWLAFDVQTWDWTFIEKDVPDVVHKWLTIFPRNVTAINGNNLYVTLTAGSVSGYKLTVFYPDNVTVVETWDNYASAAAMETAVRAGSSYVWPYEDAGGSPPTLQPTPIVVGGDRAATVSTIVSELYPYGFHHYEGPYNEWPAGESAVWLMKLFQEAVHNGNAAAKAIGPCPVDITAIDTNEFWDQFLSGGGANYCDALSFHDYNTVVNGDINVGRASIEAFFAFLESFGVDPATTEMWQTEANSSKVTDLFAVTHVRRARHTLIHTLLWEQYGIPMERNPYWYDIEHGFWGYSSFFAMGSPGQPVLPQGLMTRVLFEETYGKNFHHRVDFGSAAANRIFLGNVYGDSTEGSVMALVAASPLDLNTVTLTIDGSTADIVVVDRFGNESNVAQAAGRITVTVSDAPVYVRLPAGVNAWVYAVNDWGHDPNPSVSATKFFSSLGGASAGEIGDGLYMTKYLGGTTSPGIRFSPSTLPDAAILKFAQDVEVERVIVWGGPCWQSMPGLYDFDVDTLDNDGVTWNTQVTVTRTGSSDWFGDAVLGSQQETFWNEQWIEDVKLPAPVTTRGIRVYVRDASYGGAATADMVTFTGKDLDANSMPAPKIAVQEIAVISGTSFAAGDDYETTILADSPVGVWPGNETVGSTAATLVNGPTLDGTYGVQTVLGYDGIITNGGTAFGGGHGELGTIVVPDNAVLHVGDTFTYEGWAKFTFDREGRSSALFSKSVFEPLVEVSDTGFLRLVESNSSILVATSTAAMNIGSWFHLVCTKDGATTKMYVNGVEGTTPGTNHTFSTSTGSAQTVVASGDINAQWLAIYDHALTAERVLAHYSAGIAPAVPELSSPPKIESS